VLAWYYHILRDRSLKKPAGGRDYDYICPDEEMVILRRWSPEQMEWNLKEELEKSGHVYAISLAAHTLEERFPVAATSCTV